MCKVYLIHAVSITLCISYSHSWTTSCPCYWPAGLGSGHHCCCSPSPVHGCGCNCRICRNCHDAAEKEKFQRCTTCSYILAIRTSMFLLFVLLAVSVVHSGSPLVDLHFCMKLILWITYTWHFLLRGCWAVRECILWSGPEATAHSTRRALEHQLPDHLSSCTSQWSCLLHWEGHWSGGGVRGDWTTSTSETVLTGVTSP